MSKTYRDYINSMISSCIDFIGTERGSRHHYDLMRTFNKLVFKDVELEVTDDFSSAFIGVMAHTFGLGGYYPVKGVLANAMDWYAERKQLVVPVGYHPDVGDVAFFDCNYDGKPEYCGLVTKTTPRQLTVIAFREYVDYFTVKPLDTRILYYGQTK